VFFDDLSASPVIGNEFTGYGAAITWIGSNPENGSDHCRDDDLRHFAVTFRAIVTFGHGTIGVLDPATLKAFIGV
jgi:hypothetical protein